MDFSPPGSSVNGDSPGKNTGVDCHAPLGIFLTQTWTEPRSPNCRQILYCLSHREAPNYNPYHANSLPKNDIVTNCLSGSVDMVYRAFHDLPVSLSNLISSHFLPSGTTEKFWIILFCFSSCFVYLHNCLLLTWWILTSVSFLLYVIFSGKPGKIRSDAPLFFTTPGLSFIITMSLYEIL